MRGRVVISQEMSVGRSGRLAGRKETTTIAYTGLFLAAALIMAPSEGTAENPCNQRDIYLAHLARTYQEVPIAVGVIDQDRLVEVLSTDDGKSPDGRSCLLVGGEGWRQVPKVAATAGPKI